MVTLQIKIALNVTPLEFNPLQGFLWRLATPKNILREKTEAPVKDKT